MKTFETTKEKAGEFICEGYKAVAYDLSTPKANNKFRYGKEDENIVGKIFSVDGDIKECQWGLHFSKDPAHVFNYYEPLGYNRYFKIKAYEKVIDTKDGDKSVAQTIEFVEEYNLMQFLEIIKSFDRSSGGRNIYGGSYIYGGSDIYGGSYIYGGNNCFGVRDCKGVYNCAFCFEKNGIANRLFNKESTEKRCAAVIEKLKSFGWHPEFMNWSEVKGTKEWWAFCFPKLEEISNKAAWAKMPQKMLDYIKTLPEFDKEVFKAITE